MKQILAIAVTTVFALSLAACGENSPKQPETQSVAVQPAEVESAKPVENQPAVEATHEATHEATPGETAGATTEE